MEELKDSTIETFDQPKDAADAEPTAELAKEEALTDTDGLRKSRFDTLSIGRTVWIFKGLIAYMLCAYSLTLIDMFQVSSGHGCTLAD